MKRDVGGVQDGVAGDVTDRGDAIPPFFVCGLSRIRRARVPACREGVRRMG